MIASGRRSAGRRSSGDVTTAEVGVNINHQFICWVLECHIPHQPWCAHQISDEPLELLDAGLCRSCEESTKLLCSISPPGRSRDKSLARAASALKVVASSPFTTSPLLSNRSAALAALAPILFILYLALVLVLAIISAVVGSQALPSSITFLNVAARITSS